MGYPESIQGDLDRCVNVITVAADRYIVPIVMLYQVTVTGLSWQVM